MMAVLIDQILKFVLGGLGALWRLIVPAAPWILAGVVGAVLWHFLPVLGPSGKLARLDAERDVAVEAAAAWKRHAQGWEASFHASEGRRADDQENANQAASYAAASCLTQIERARASARVIERIVTQEPAYDENRCPVRSLVDPDQLRDAIAPD